MKHVTPIRSLFVVAGLYDGLLGAAFLIAGPAVYDHFDITPPNHWGYVQFPAALLIVFGLMFLAVAIDPSVNRPFMLAGVGLKLSFCGVVICHWLLGPLPGLWKPFAVCDALFALLFLWAWVAVGRPRANQRSSPL